MSDLDGLLERLIAEREAPSRWWKTGPRPPVTRKSRPLVDTAYIPGYRMDLPIDVKIDLLVQHGRLE